MASLSHLSLIFLASTLFVPSLICATLGNLTIDDTNTAYFTFTNDPDANPPSWAAITPAKPCLYCSAQPMTDQIHNQTWHDGSVGSAGSFTFQGSAVYIYGIDLEHPANISFTMGNHTAFHYYNGSEQFVFDALFFAAANLADGVNHTVSWVLDKTDLNGTTGLFDYAVVTVDSTSGSSSGSVPNEGSTSKRKPRIGTIVGAVLGAVGGLAILAALLSLHLFFRGHNNRNQNVSPAADKPRRAQRVRDNYIIRPFSETAPSTTQSQARTPTQPLSPTTPTAGTRAEKTLEIPSTAPTHSVVSTSPVSPRSPTEISTRPSTTSMSTSVRERFLEDRLAILEAHVQQHLPPLYEPPPEGGRGLSG
ncbi:hypothetical protein DFH06DRAFT_347594 [Mycena polygramma]|nr:hypothetical protein DFH06DRAFT_347594 [Mycena polygramma]